MRKKNKILIGSILILLGALLLFLNIHLFKGYWTLLLTGILLYVIYHIFEGASKPGNIGIILPATFSFFLWSFFLFDQIELINHNGFILIFLSFGFFSSFLIHKSPYFPPMFWLLYTGGILFVLGLAWLLAAFTLFPLLFILAGIAIILKGK